MITFEFYLPKNKQAQNIHLSITARFNLNTSDYQKFIFRTPLQITADQWDETKQRPLNIYLKKNKKINTSLDQLKIRLTEYIKERNTLKKVPSKKILFYEIIEICTAKTVQFPNHSLLYFTQLYIDSKKELISHSTFKRYMVFLRLIEKFEGFIMERLYVDTIDGNFINNFILFGKEEAYSENTIYRTVHFIRTILLFAERKGIRTSIRELEIRREKQQREMVTLTENEILRIKKADVPKELQAAKDWLLISCYTGQRVSDFMEFSTEKLIDINGKKCIAFTQKLSLIHI